MHSQKDALKILGCSKMTLSRYVKDGKLNRVKQGRETFYDEVEVGRLITEIEKNKQRIGMEIKPKEKIELPKKAKDEIAQLSANSSLNTIGMDTLATATKQLIDLGLYEDCDKQILLNYALSTQAYNHYFVKSMEIDGVNIDGQIAELEDGSKMMFVGKVGVHSYHKIMMDHQKMMLNYSDRLGLNPLARLKFDIQEEEERDEMEDLIG